MSVVDGGNIVGQQTYLARKCNRWSGGVYVVPEVLVYFFPEPIIADFTMTTKQDVTIQILTL